MKKMNYYGHNDYRDYLSHHGILGMKWGKRNGPPYPLGPSDHSASEKKAGWQDSLKGKVRYKGDTNSSDKSQAGITAAKIAIDILTLNPISAASDIYRVGQAAVARNKEKANEKRISKLEIDKKTGLHLKSDTTSKEDDMKHVNPGFKDFDKNTKNNCVLCTVAYDMRRRGYDVSAKKTTTGYESNYTTTLYKNAKLEQIHVPKSYDELKKDRQKTVAFGGNKELASKTVDSLVKQGDGARGALLVQWGGQGGGHSMVYEVENSKVVIRDCQSNKTYKPEKILTKCYAAQYVRLDNVDFDPKKIKEAVR